MHADDGKDVDDDTEDESEVAKGAEGLKDDAQEDTHRRPRLSQLEDSQETQLEKVKVTVVESENKCWTKIKASHKT